MPPLEEGLARRPIELDGGGAALVPVPVVQIEVAVLSQGHLQVPGMYLQGNTGTHQVTVGVPLDEFPRDFLQLVQVPGRLLRIESHLAEGQLVVEEDRNGDRDGHRPQISVHRVVLDGLRVEV